MNPDLLSWVKARRWFYPFGLPAGSTTPTEIGVSVELLHTTRRARLGEVIPTRLPDAARLTALAAEGR